MIKISETGLSKAEILRRLYNAAILQVSVADHYPPNTMSLDQAKKMLEQDYYFESINGRVMEISVAHDEIDTRQYNFYNGENAAESAINIEWGI